MADTKKPELTLVGPTVGAPSFDDMMKLYKKLTGKDPTPRQIEEAKAAWETK